MAVHQRVVGIRGGSRSVTEAQTDNDYLEVFVYIFRPIFSQNWCTPSLGRARHITMAEPKSGTKAMSLGQVTSRLHTTPKGSLGSSGGLTCYTAGHRLAEATPGRHQINFVSASSALETVIIDSLNCHSSFHLSSVVCKINLQLAFYMILSTSLKHYFLSLECVIKYLKKSVMKLLDRYCHSLKTSTYTTE
ncbi:hypothetical protein NPIL_78531 [Nephila pilipes]|uniref:Uncharacterized protein n=1 Tax=Nephila pilipes TaxID=299642 RepID=A0A8X6Q2W8_NEPPI|nr:hypothetical protein NPIL_78531 [Nephila pilipes]